MSIDTPEVPKVHPLIAALERRDEATVELRGFLGTSGDKVVRLYQAMDTSSYVEIPKDGLVYLETLENGEPGEVRAFVIADLKVLEVRRLQASDLSVELEFVAHPEVLQSFWSCARRCEITFAAAATRILADEAQALAEQDPQRQAHLLGQIAARKSQAKSALLLCLTTCLSTARPPGPGFMKVPDDSPRGYHYERFSLPGYHGLLIEKYLERPT